MHSSHRVDLLHKSHNAPVPYPTMHHFVTEMCTCVHISVTKWCIAGYLSNALWDLWDGSLGMLGLPFPSWHWAMSTAATRPAGHSHSLVTHRITMAHHSYNTKLSSYPGYFREPHWFSVGLPEISRVTWQLCNTDGTFPKTVTLENVILKIDFIVSGWWLCTVWHHVTCYMML